MFHILKIESFRVIFKIVVLSPTNCDCVIDGRSQYYTEVEFMLHTGIGRVECSSCSKILTNGSRNHFKFDTDEL